MTTIKTAIDDYSYGIRGLAKKAQKEYLSKLTIFAEWAERQNPQIELETLKQTSIRQFMAELPNHINPQTK